MHIASCKLRIATFGRRFALLPAAAVAAGGMSCAKAPGGGASGVRLVVTMRFAGNVNNTYHYFLLMRNAGDDIGQNGPIPVVEPPYGVNGFATDKSRSSSTAAFTDFVHYNRSNQQFISSSGYTLYHVPGGFQGNTERPDFFVRGNPASTTDPTGSPVLQFEVDLSQIAPADGEPAPNPDLRPRYIQVNFIATTTTPANRVTPDPDYVMDALGNQSSGIISDSFNTFITIDTSQIGKTYSSTLSPGPDEPSGDPYPADRDPAVDMVFWSVQVVGR